MGELGISMVMATIAPTDLALIAQNAADSMSLRALQANLRLTCRFDDALIALCDADRIRQVIDHLIENALRYTAAPGKIIIAGGKSDGMATLTVDDTAPAQPDDALPHLFERFYRAEKSRSRAERVWSWPVDLQSVFPPRTRRLRIDGVAAHDPTAWHNGRTRSDDG
jgi:signal transduction histidine kinase